MTFDPKLQGHDSLGRLDFIWDNLGNAQVSCDTNFRLDKSGKVKRCDQGKPWPGGHTCSLGLRNLAVDPEFMFAVTPQNTVLKKIRCYMKIASFIVWVRYSVWNFKRTLWNSTQNILPKHWKMSVLISGENLRALIFKSWEAFLKRPQNSKHLDDIIPRMTMSFMPNDSSVHRISVICRMKNTLRASPSAAQREYTF